MIVPTRLRSAAVVLLLAACETASPDYVEFRSRQDPLTTATRIAENVGDCWFNADRAAFAEYSYAPELNSFSGRPRILIVPADNPAGLPLLVIEASQEDRRTNVRLFGPLMASGEASAISRDIGRWADGATGCA